MIKPIHLHHKPSVSHRFSRNLGIQLHRINIFREKPAKHFLILQSLSLVFWL
ncbi:hypothetical protein RchiOBHm_Chr5g0006101 [Rosa chinensis]|uniref:Uncharacterized protein n=1 Tax=Rosa chinensis TaxID=74649 RepID=A0A2P6Q3G2_ROSCH|nr:hypothetical protein RchiOBHm_Chr5g0006101 [Rosa chinensis]